MSVVNRRAELHLPYFKQGDDMRSCVEQTKNSYQAFLAHAQNMESTMKILRDLAAKTEGVDLTIDACTHHISVEGPVELIDSLITQGLLYPDPFEDEEEEWEDDDEWEDDEEVS